tara:strand:- start:7949 stop:8758 length:810 start_codon:yes stop_codon:yes gene_type:complete
MTCTNSEEKRAKRANNVRESVTGKQRVTLLCTGYIIIHTTEKYIKMANSAMTGYRGHQETNDTETTDSWPGFCRAYARQFSISYAASVCEAGPAWAEYKKKHNLHFKYEKKKPYPTQPQQQQQQQKEYYEPRRQTTQEKLLQEKKGEEKKQAHRKGSKRQREDGEQVSSGSDSGEEEMAESPPLRTIVERVPRNNIPVPTQTGPKKRKVSQKKKKNIPQEDHSVYYNPQQMQQLQNMQQGYGPMWYGPPQGPPMNSSQNYGHMLPDNQY